MFQAENSKFGQYNSGTGSDTQGFDSGSDSTNNRQAKRSNEMLSPEEYKEIFDAFHDHDEFNNFISFVRKKSPSDAQELENNFSILASILRFNIR